jgi:hypothetical protein
MKPSSKAFKVRVFGLGLRAILSGCTGVRWDAGFVTLACLLNLGSSFLNFVNGVGELTSPNAETLRGRLL